MNAEDRLRALLREEATMLVPSGDGLSRIQARVARKRRLRVFLLPSAALATTGAVAAFFLLGSTPTTTLTQEPAASPTQPTVEDRYTGPALSPYTSQDKDDVVQHWLRAVGVAAQPLPHTCESCDVVDIGVGGTSVGTAVLARSHQGATITYTLVSVDGTDLTISTPKAGAAVSAPLPVSGRITGVDEHVALSLVDDAGKEIGNGGAQAGSEVPWRASLSWTDTTWSNGALLARTYSPKDGALNRLVAVPISRASG